MPSIADLLDTTTIAKLEHVVVVADTAGPAKRKKARPATSTEYVVTKAATDPNPPRPLTASDLIVIDPRGEALMDVTCVDCAKRFMVNPVPIVKAHEDLDEPIVYASVCPKCAQVRLDFAAIVSQRKIETQRRRETTKEEQPVINLQDIDDGDLGADIKASLLAERTKEIKKGAKRRREADNWYSQQVQAEVAREQKARTKRVLPEVTIKDVTIPALDLRDVSTLNEMPDAAMRSPYNRALNRLGEPILDKETATYATILEVHQRLLHGDEPIVVADEPIVVADVDMKAPAKKVGKKDKKVAGFMKLGLDEATARRMANA